MDKLFEDGQKEIMANRLDPNGSERDLGWISMMLVPVLGEQEIMEVTDRKQLPPLVKMIRRAAKQQEGGQP